VVSAALAIPGATRGSGKAIGSADGRIVKACTRAMLVTAGRMGSTYLDRPHEIDAVRTAFSRIA
jgi:hypothetical protein